MAETTLPKGLIKRKDLSFEEWVSFQERVSRSHHEIYTILQRIELAHAFAEYESDKTENDPPIKIHALAILLGDIQQLLNCESEKLWHISLDLLPHEARRGDV